jgi:hypothetical protein
MLSVIVRDLEVSICACTLLSVWWERRERKEGGRKQRFMVSFVLGIQSVCAGSLRSTTYDLITQ